MSNSNSSSSSNNNMSVEQVLQVVQQQQIQIQLTQEQNKHLLQQNNIISQQLASLQDSIKSNNNSNNNNNNINNNTNNNNRSYIKATPPPSFSGEHGIHVAQEFVYKCEQYFRVQEIPNHKQVDVAANSFEKNAMQWFVRLRNSLQDNTSTEETKILTDWVTFKIAFLSYFQPVEIKRIARAKLNSIIQKGSISSYCNHFMDLLNKLGGNTEMELQQQLFLFRKGINPHIRVYVDLKEPKNLDEAMRFAQRFEAEAFVTRNESGIYKANNNTKSNYNDRSRYNNNTMRFNTSSNSSSSSAGTNHGAGPMDLNNMNRQNDQDDPNTETDNKYDNNNEEENFNYMNNNNNTGYNTARNNNNNNNSSSSNNNSNNNRTRLVNLPKEEFKRCLKEGICFKCKLKGHLARDCTKK